MGRSHTIGNFLLAIAALSMLVSLAYENVDISTGKYRGALLTSVMAMTIADLLCVPQFFRRGRTRWIAVLIALPSLFVLWDFTRRGGWKRF